MRHRDPWANGIHLRNQVHSLKDPYCGDSRTGLDQPMAGTVSLKSSWLVYRVSIFRSVSWNVADRSDSGACAVGTN